MKESWESLSCIFLQYRTHFFCLTLNSWLRSVLCSTIHRSSSIIVVWNVNTIFIYNSNNVRLWWWLRILLLFLENKWKNISVLLRAEFIKANEFINFATQAMTKITWNIYRKLSQNLFIQMLHKCNCIIANEPNEMRQTLHGSRCIPSINCDLFDFPRGNEDDVKMIYLLQTICLKI